MPSIKFQPYVDFAGIYSSGLVGVTLVNGSLVNNSSFGTRLGFGVSGRHNWRHTDVGLDYRGSLSHYIGNSYYDSTSQALFLGVRHSFTRHITLNISEAAGMFSRTYGLLGIPQTSLYDPATTDVPTNDYFDNRTIYLTSAANLVIQRSARLSFSAGGTAMNILRRSEALRGSFGWGAHGDVQYRVSRRTTVGAQYQYQNYRYSNFIGGADVNGVAATFSRAFSARTEFSAYAGASHIEVKNLVTRPTDPVITALLGITETSQIVHYLSWTPTFGLRISRRVPQGILFATATRGISPGNGLFLTSESTSLTTGYNYLGLRRWSASVSGSYYYNKAVTGVTGNYRAASAGIHVARKIGPVNFITWYAVRQYDSGTYGKYSRLIHEATIGLGWTPGEIPLRIW